MIPPSDGPIPPGSEFFFSLFVWDRFPSRAIFQNVLSETFIQHFNLLYMAPLS